MLKLHLPLSLSFFLLASAAVHAAELGDVRVASHTGQPLVADIELALVEDPAQAVEARVASPEVYNGAGIALPEVLSSIHLSTMRRDGRQFLHVTSLRPVDADHVHLYLELTDKGQRGVRLVTLWLTPDPHPASVPLAAPVTAPAGPVVTPAAEAPPARIDAVRPPAAAAPRAPAPAPRSPAPPQAAPEAHAVRKPLLLPDPLFGAKPEPSRPAACPRPHADPSAQACAALGAKNAELRAQLGKLENRVKGIQDKLGVPAEHGQPPAAAPAQPPKPLPLPVHADKPAGPKPINAIKPLVPRKPKVVEPDDPFPWGLAGAAAAILAGCAALVALRRRRTPRNVHIPAAPHPIAALLARLKGRRGAPAAAEAVAEPRLD